MVRVKEMEIRNAKVTKSVYLLAGRRISFTANEMIRFKNRSGGQRRNDAEIFLGYNGYSGRYTL